MQKWIFYSTIFAVFSDTLAVQIGGVSFFYYYFLLLLNLGYLAAIGKLWLPRKLLCFLGYLTLSGLVGFALNTNSAAGFLKAYLGIVISAVYYAAFVRYTRFNVFRVFDRYAACTFYASAFGILYLPFQPYIKGRLTSLMLEPSTFCLICLPAAYYYADEWQRRRKYGLRCVVVLIALALTFSSVGYLGAMLGVFLFGGRYRRGRLVFAVVVALIGVGIYTASDLFRLRVNDSTQVLAAADVSNVNDSTLGLALSYLVVKDEFAVHPLIGGGLGSHVVAHDRYVPQIPELYPFAGKPILDLGRWDASSLLLRIVSELGLFGLGYALWFLWHYWPRGGNAQQKAIAASLMCYAFMKFLRAGSYFQTETFLFLAVYAVNGLLAQTQQALARNAVIVVPPPVRFEPTWNGITPRLLGEEHLAR